VLDSLRRIVAAAGRTPARRSFTQLFALEQIAASRRLVQRPRPLTFTIRVRSRSSSSGWSNAVWCPLAFAVDRRRSQLGRRPASGSCARRRTSCSSG
jgi:hypothetical protein